MVSIKFNKETKEYLMSKSEPGEAYTVKGDLQKVTEAAILEGVRQEEHTVVYNNMVENNHLEAEFGINGYFLFSK